MRQYSRRGSCDTFLTAGFLNRTPDVRISRRNLSILACVTKKYISSMSEGESEREGWKDDSSSESRDEIGLALLILLMLDIEDTPEPLLLAEREGKGSMVTSCRYLKSRARLKERSTSSNSSSSLQRRGSCGMSTRSKEKNEGDEHYCRVSPMGGSD